MLLDNRLISEVLEISKKTFMEGKWDGICSCLIDSLEFIESREGISLPISKNGKYLLLEITPLPEFTPLFFKDTVRYYILELFDESNRDEYLDRFW